MTGSSDRKTAHKAKAIAYLSWQLDNSRIKNRDGECMKAYKVTSLGHEISIVVLAETPNQAKIKGMWSEWFGGEEYISMRATREKWADNLNNLDFCSNAELYNANGWYCNSSDMCNNKCVFKEDE